MEKTIRICDKCGKEEEVSNSLKVKTCILNRQLDLCDGCEKVSVKMLERWKEELEQWLGGI